MCYYISRFYLILILSSFLNPCSYVGTSHASNEDKTPGIKRTISQRDAEKPSEDQSNKKIERKGKEGKTKKLKTHETVSSSSSKEEEESEEGDSEEREEEEGGTTGSSSAVIPVETSAEIGKWVGDKERGIETLKLTYKGTPISEEIIKWHLASGAQIKEIVGKIDPTDRTNFIRARIDFLYEIQGSYNSIPLEIPALFISGHSNERAKKEVTEIQETISSITALPCIPINSYFGWGKLGDENYKGIRKKLHPLFEKANVSEEGHKILISSLRNCLKKRKHP
jgi:hypothetical protein